jgi:cytochrome c-type biogenesis protein CcmH
MRFRNTVRSVAPTLLALAILAAMATARAGEESARPTVESIGEHLVCQCGCNYGLNNCTHNNCASDEEMKAFMKKEISEGKDEPAILKALVDRYGVKVLAAPPAEGFNLAAWVLPGLALVMGLVVVTLAVRRLRRPAAATGATTSPVDPDLLAAIEEEMKEVAES